MKEINKMKMKSLRLNNKITILQNNHKLEEFDIIYTGFIYKS